MAWSTAAKSPAYNTAEYRAARLACLKAARWKCEIRIPGTCIGAASQADHTDGLANDPHHRKLRAACVPCHRSVTAQQGKGARAGTPPADPAPVPRTDWGAEPPPPF
jgi:hypothetical protein